MDILIHLEYTILHVYMSWWSCETNVAIFYPKNNWMVEIEADETPRRLNIEFYP